MKKSKDTSIEKKQPDTIDDKTMRRILKEAAQDIPPVNPAVFSRIERSISDSAAQNKSDVSSAESSLAALIKTFRTFFARPQFAWGVVAAQAIVLCLFFVFTPGKSTYQTLSTGQADIQSAATVFYVIFSDTARVKDIEQLLTQTNCIIVNGPVKNGIYTVKLQPPQTRNMEAFLETMQESPFITLIEQAY
jgi:hypothetical protein